MILLIQASGTRRQQQFMHALPELRIAHRREFGAHALVARLPGRAAVIRIKRPHRRDCHPEALRIIGVHDDGMEAQAAESWLPLSAGGMLTQPGDVFPGGAAVGAAEESRWIDAGIEQSMITGDVPDLLDHRPLITIAET